MHDEMERALVMERQEEIAIDVQIPFVHEHGRSLAEVVRGRLGDF